MPALKYNEQRRFQLKANVKRLQIFFTIIDALIDKSGAELREISDHSGVSLPTIYFWLNGTTRNPRIDTISKVASCIGFEIILKKAGRPQLRLVR